MLPQSQGDNERLPMGGVGSILRLQQDLWRRKKGDDADDGDADDADDGGDYETQTQWRCS